MFSAVKSFQRDNGRMHPSWAEKGIYFVIKLSLISLETKRQIEFPEHISSHLRSSDSSFPIFTKLS